MQNSRTFILFLLLSLTGCAESSRSNIEQLTPTFEVTTETDAARNELESVKSDFVVDLENLMAIEQRVSIFFSHYLHTSPLQRVLTPGTTEVLAQSAHFTYQITRSVDAGGYRYRVMCSAKSRGTDLFAAEQNARVLALFLQQGTIEESLLVQ